MSFAPDELWRLEHPDQTPPLEALQGLALHLRLWRYPPAGAYLSYGLFVPVREEVQPLVRGIRWRPRRRSPALAALKRRPPAATLPSVRDAIVGAEALAPFLAEAPAILGTFAERPEPLELEGEHRGIEGYGALTHARFEWNAFSDHPVARWTERLWSLLEAALRDRETS